MNSRPSSPNSGHHKSHSHSPTSNHRLNILDSPDHKRNSPSSTGGGRNPSNHHSNHPTLPTYINSSNPSSSNLDLINHPALPVLSYCAASILMTVVNKFVVSGHHFTMNFLLLTIQSAVCVTCVAFSKSLKLINYRDFDVSDAKRWFPISFLLVIVIYTGSKALQFLSIPVYTIFKNLTIILIAYGEVLWFGGHVSGLTLVSFALMVLSSLVAAWSDISSAIFLSPVTATALAAATSETSLQQVENYSELVKKHAGYFWMLINCLASAGYVLAMRKRIKLTSFKDWDTMFYNNLLSIPVLVIFSFLFEDWSESSLTANFPIEGRTFLLAAMAFSGAAAVFISYTTAWCVRTTSSTTYSMVGALNKLPVAASGMIFFGDPVSVGNVSAISIGFFAGLVYTVAKIKPNNSLEIGGKGYKS